MDFTNNDADGNGRISSNDTLTLAYSQCVGLYGLTYNGTISASLSAVTLLPASITSLFTLSSFTVTDGTNTVNLTGDLTYSTSIDFSTRFGAASISGTSLAVTIDLAGQEGSVTFLTTTNFQGTATSLHPTSGVMIVTGASNGKLTITLSDEAITLEGDVNGDGTNDFSTSTTWSEIG